tara:strand:- start:3835 stop:5079 length:1245 start_codon:yes stop_codon:yes gene_type:complete
LQLARNINLAVIGGGAAGFMGAITAAEGGAKSVFIFELMSHTLEKVRISGGGRCNVTHACWDPKDLVPNYPRGEVPLIGAFSRFATGDALAWFEDRGLELISEEDGRIFPKSNSSKDVIKCLHDSAKRAGVICSTQMKVENIDSLGQTGFRLKFNDGSVIYSKKVLIATGGHPSGKKLAFKLGHEIIPSAPSLFGFKIDSHSLGDCAGISVDKVQLKLLCGKRLFKEEGRVLITHKGLSGPGIFRLSAFAARDLYDKKYKALLEINWVNQTHDSMKRLFEAYRRDYPKNTLFNNHPFQSIPKRMWVSFLHQINLLPSKRWSSFSKLEEKRLTENLIKKEYRIFAKGPFGEEFVTAGGVNLEQVNMKSMESRLCKGLYFAGEVLDIDGVTGGFNFQHCWTSGWIAGEEIAKSLLI